MRNLSDKFPQLPKSPFSKNREKLLYREKPDNSFKTNGNGEDYYFFELIDKLALSGGRLLQEFRQFSGELANYLIRTLRLSFIKFEAGKGVFVAILYRQRGKYARRFMHSGMAGLTALGIMIAPVIAEEFPGDNPNPWEIQSPSSVLSASTENPETTTLVSEKARDKIIEYEVQVGDTVSSIADKFGVSTDTVLWQNNLSANESIKPGETLEILPVSGISHKVTKGDTV